MKKKKEMKDKPSGSGAGAKKRKWAYFNQLTFLDDVRVQFEETAEQSQPTENNQTNQGNERRDLCFVA